jgi:hypothetical protein
MFEPFVDPSLVIYEYLNVFDVCLNLCEIMLVNCEANVVILIPSVQI